MKRFTCFCLLIALLFSCHDRPPATRSDKSIDRKWWKEAIVYQLYPRSFKDANGEHEILNM